MSSILHRYGVTELFEPEDLIELRNIPKVTKCIAQLSKMVRSFETTRKFLRS